MWRGAFLHFALVVSAAASLQAAYEGTSPVQLQMQVVAETDSESAVAGTSLEPVLRLEFDADSNTLESVREFFTQFSKEYELSVKDISASLPPKDGRTLLFIELYREDKISVTVAGNLNRNGHVFVFVYDTSDNGDTQRHLTRRLKDLWPSARIYHGM